MIAQIELKILETSATIFLPSFLQISPIISSTSDITLNTAPHIFSDIFCTLLKTFRTVVKIFFSTDMTASFMASPFSFHQDLIAPKTLEIILHMFVKAVFAPFSRSEKMPSINGHSSWIILTISPITRPTTSSILFSADITCSLIAAPFCCHQLFMTFKAPTIIVFIFSHIFFTALRKSSLVFHK